ncbi:hypothetical protein GF312_22625 [Candidatus Poribacteria bacterium]|nr:hypothetical protein [Candidatus Poribacteria bacterium]
MPITKALFIGNSYTFCNKMPWIVSKLAESAGKQLEVEMVTQGGVDFQWHINNQETLDAIDKDIWDFIVLQNHSLAAVEKRDDMIKYGDMLIQRTQETKAKTVLFMTWARQHIPEMIEDIVGAYTELAEKNNTIIAPVGLAWKKALEADKALILHTEDKSHPNPLGSYLVACVFYSTFYNASPEGLAGRIEIDGETIVDLPDSQAAFLQSTAWFATGG